MKDRSPHTVWMGAQTEVNAHLAAAAPPRGLESSGAPVDEQAHEFVVREKVERSVSAGALRERL